MIRLGDDDRHFGPITAARATWNPWRAVLSSGDDDEDRGNSLTIYAFGWVVRVALPAILTPYRVRYRAPWDAQTIARMGRDYHIVSHPREYGFSLFNGFLQLFLGAQTDDSTSTQGWCCHLPWTQWRHVRFTLYTPDGAHYWTQWDEEVPGLRRFDEMRSHQESCPSISFDFDDYDGQRITARCRIEEREWRFGEGWFAWLSVFRRAKIVRSLSLEFDKEVGPEKGSWKGGRTGHGIEMLPDESCESAFRRYCEQEHRSKHRTFRLRYVRNNGR